MDLVGTSFSLEEETYTVIDVRQIGAETMVYAQTGAGESGPGKAAFRLVDIQGHLMSDEAV